ncbi:MAG: MutS-related protein [Oscillospiraceae bacterium]
MQTFGQEKIRKSRYYSPDEREELETELYNVEQAAKAADALKPLYDRIGLMLCQMKDIRGSLRRCQALEVPDHVELFEIKVYLQRLESLIPLFRQVCETTHFKALAFHDPAQALEILDPDKTRTVASTSPTMQHQAEEIRAAKKQIEEQRTMHRPMPRRNCAPPDRVCAEEDSEETKVRRSMGQALAPLAGDLLEDADTAGRLDFIIQKALFAVRYGGVRPEITETELELTDMINPELCDLLEQKGRSFVPVSIRLEQGATVITGANMGGKSVVMKTVALNVLLLQAGFLVCAKKARMPLFYSVKMLFDDLQSIQSGLSGFGSEIVQFQKALEEVEQGYSLFLLDEFARGTNPDEGAVIVQAVTKYLNEVNAISLLTTHYDKVAENARLHYQIIGLRDVDPEQIRQELAATGDDAFRSSHGT